MNRVKRAIPVVAVVCAVLAAGCQKSHIQRMRREARERWAVSRAEMVTKLAEGSFRRGEVARARQQIEEVLRAAPAYVPLYVLAARIATEDGNLDEARRFAEAAQSLDPESAVACYVAGTVAHALGDGESALAAFSEAARLDPERPAYVLAEAELLVALDRAEYAASRLDEAVGHMPGRPEVHIALGDVLSLLNRDAQAAGWYRIALRLDPKADGLRSRFATALFFSGAYGAAEAALAELIEEAEADETARWALPMQGECLLALGRVPEARAVYERLAKAEPNSAEPLGGLAKCDILEGEHASAQKSLEAALARRPQDSEANALMGYLFLAEGRPGEAVSHLRLALKDPDCERRETVERLLSRAMSGEPPEVAGEGKAAAAWGAPLADEQPPSPSVGRSKGYELPGRGYVKFTTNGDIVEVHCGD